MPERISIDLCVVGAGPGGLAVAAAGAQLGFSTILVEDGVMGGSELDGSVASKALVAAARAAVQYRRSEPFGVSYDRPRIDFAHVRDHVRAAIAAVEADDSRARYEGLGVRVVHAKARFTGPDRLRAGDIEIAAWRFCIAAGARPLLPPIKGLDRVAYRTPRDIVDLDSLPSPLVVVGGGVEGCELGQAFRRLGARVTILETESLLGGEDPELVEIVRRQLRFDGVELREGAAVVQLDQVGAGVRATLAQGADRSAVEGSHLLLAAGRTPASDELGLDAAGVACDDKAIRIDGRCRTTNRRVYALGDVAGGPPATAWAAHQAMVIVKSMMFRLPARTKARLLPRVAFTDPELAQVGLTEAAARAAGHERIVVRRFPFAETDRARTDRAAAGFVKLVATPQGRILGAGIVGASAGELIQSWGLALAAGLSLRAFTDMITASPTLSEASKRVAGGFYAERMLTARMRRWVRWLARWP